MLEFLRRLNETLPPVPTEYILIGFGVLLLYAWIIRWRPKWLWRFFVCFLLLRTAAFLLAGK